MAKSASKTPPRPWNAAPQQAPWLAAAEQPRRGPQTRSQLLALAQVRGLEGRSRMTKAELEQALRLH